MLLLLLLLRMMDVLLRIGDNADSRDIYFDVFLCVCACVRLIVF